MLRLVVSEDLTVFEATKRAIPTERATQFLADGRLVVEFPFQVALWVRHSLPSLRLEEIPCRFKIFTCIRCQFIGALYPCYGCVVINVIIGNVSPVKRRGIIIENGTTTKPIC